MTSTMYDPSTRHGHLDAYAKIHATKQGNIKGNSTRDDKKDFVVVLGLEFGCKTPRDLATGQAAGRRQYEVLEIEIEMSPAATQLMQSCATNEVLDKAEFQIYRHSHATGVAEIGTKINLEKATVAQYRFVAGDEDTSYYPHVRIALSFDKIEVETEKTVMSDSWTHR